MVYETRVDPRSKAAWPFVVAASLSAMAPHVASASEPCGTASSAEPTPEALANYETAISLSKEGRYAEALAAYRRAHELSPSWVILYNLAKAAALSGDPVQAIEAYTCHLELGAEEIDPTRRSEVLAEVKRLRGEVGLVVLEVDALAVELFVDDRKVGTSPLDEPVMVNPGSRLVRAKGARTETRTIDVTRGGRLVVKFEFGAPTVAPAEGPAFRFPGAVVGVSWIVTGLLGVGAAVTGAMALATSEDVANDTYLGPGRAPPAGSAVDEKIERARSLAVATDVLITIGAITGAAAVSFSVVNLVGEDAPEAAPKVGLGLGFVNLEWIF